MRTVKIFTVIIIFTLLFTSCSTYENKQEIIDKKNSGNESDTNFISNTKEIKAFEIPDSIFFFSNLKHLTINGMACQPPFKSSGADWDPKDTCYKLKKISKKIQMLTHLASLSLSDNNIKEIPKELAKLMHLKVLNLQYNPLESVSGIENIQSLEELYLNGCPIEKLPDNIKKLTNLKILGLSKTKLIKAEEIKIKKALPNCYIQFP